MNEDLKLTVCFGFDQVYVFHILNDLQEKGLVLKWDFEEKEIPEELQQEHGPRMIEYTIYFKDARAIYFFGHQQASTNPFKHYNG